MPVGALGELKPMLDAIAQAEARPRLFLGLRDVLDAPEVIRAVWTDLAAYDYLPRYDDVMVYGCRDILDADAAYGLTPYVRKVTYCNYVVTRPTAPTASPPAAGSEEPLVLVIGGGGGDAFPLMKAFVEALPVIARQIRLRALIVTGPNMPPAQREALLARADAYPIEIQGSAEDAIGLLQQATAVVTRAGYNSLCEVLQWRKKALVVPRPGPSAEQRIRTRLFARQRLIRMLDPDALAPARLAEELVALLTDDGMPAEANIPQMDGAQRAAALLIGEPTAESGRSFPLGLAAGG
jgi:predicted glycosyltransferase